MVNPLTELVFTPNRKIGNRMGKDINLKYYNLIFQNNDKKMRISKARISWLMIFPVTKRAPDLSS